MRRANAARADAMQSHVPVTHAPVLLRNQRLKHEQQIGNQALLRRLSRTTPHLQHKLTIGAVSDPLEAEADCMADHVMRASDPDQSLSITTGRLSRKCAECEEEDKKLNAKPDGALVQSDAPSLVRDVLNSPGQPLDSSTRDFMEPRFGRDFSKVRVHHDANAGMSASAVNALAYAVNQDVVFGPGRYDPQSREGKHLLAHELAHVVQQGQTTPKAGGQVQRQETPDAGAPPDQTSDTGRAAQMECVGRLGGCINMRSGGVPSPEEIASYNKTCRTDSGYTGADLTPTDADCAGKPSKPLTTGEKIIIGVLVGAAVVGAIALVVLTDGATAPVIVSGLSTVGDVAAGTELAAGTQVVGEATAAVAAGGAAATLTVAEAATQALAAAASAVNNGQKFIMAARAVSAMVGMGALQKVDVILEVIRRIGFGFSMQGVVDHGEYFELASEDGRYVFRFMVDTAKIVYGKFDMATMKMIWENL